MCIVLKRITPGDLSRSRRKTTVTMGTEPLQLGSKPFSRNPLGFTHQFKLEKFKRSRSRFSETIGLLNTFQFQERCLLDAPLSGLDHRRVPTANLCGLVKEQNLGPLFNIGISEMEL